MPQPSAVDVMVATVATIVDRHRLRCDYLAAEMRISNQVKALGRRLGDETAAEVASAPMLAARAILQEARKAPEREMAKAAQQLPVWGWVEGLRGLGPLGLAQIVGECGDLSHYAGPAKLWARMGVGLRQRSDGAWTRQQLTKEGADGYVPRRRSVLFNLGEAIVRVGGPYRAVYDERKEYERARPSCGRVLRDGKGRCASPEGGCAPGHIHNRARRYMEKRLLRDLWRAWRGLDVELPAVATPEVAAA